MPPAQPPSGLASSLFKRFIYLLYSIFKEFFSHLHYSCNLCTEFLVSFHPFFTFYIHIFIDYHISPELIFCNLVVQCIFGDFSSLCFESWPHPFTGISGL